MELYSLQGSDLNVRSQRDKRRQYFKEITK